MYFMRHGQSEFNVIFDRTGIAPDMPDAPLSAHGKQQVVRAARELKDRGFVRVVSSLYTRAIETASIAADQFGLSVEVDPLIGEHRMYSCDIGIPASVQKERFKNVDFKGFESDDWWLPFPESKASVEGRLRAFESKWKGHQDWGKILFVSHYYFLLAATGHGLGNAEVVRWK